jgi:hypothetical protein
MSRRELYGKGTLPATPFREEQWASTEERARDQDFNVVNGDIFRWSWMWGRIAEWFGLRPAPLEPAPNVVRGLTAAGRGSIARTS